RMPDTGGARRRRGDGARPSGHPSGRRGRGEGGRHGGRQHGRRAHGGTMSSDEQKLAKASQPADDAMRLHPYYRGKMQTLPKCAIRSVADFSVWYTPGVAAPCKAIQRDPELSCGHTNRGNLVAVVSDGSRVLGLGDIGPEAGLPVMEGKALLFKYLGGVDAVALCLRSRNDDEFVRAVEMLEPSFGAINLED